VRPHSQDRSPGRPSLGVRFPFRAELCVGCPRSGIVATACAAPPSSQARESPLLGFLLPSSTSTPGAPCHTHRGLAPAAGRVRIANPSPVPSSGFLPLSTVLAALAARTRTPLSEHARRSPWRPDASRPCSMPLAPTGVVLQSFPFPRSRTRSRGPFLPCGFAQTAQRRGSVRGFRGSFRHCADLSPRLARRLAGLQGRDNGSLESLGRRTCHVAVVVCDVSSRNGRARRTRLPARPLRSFALPESPFADTDRRPGQGAINRSVLSWTFFPSRAFSSSPWVRYARG